MMFEGIIYPPAVLDVVAAVTSGEWSGPDPERVIDTMLTDFARERACDRLSWARSIAAAVGDLNCLDFLAARLNLYCLTPEQTPDDTISVPRRKDEQPHTGRYDCQCGDCLFAAMKSSEPAIVPAGRTYRVGPRISVMSTRGQRAAISAILRASEAGYIDDINVVQSRLESFMRSRGPEQIVVTRLAFLVAISMAATVGDVLGIASRPDTPLLGAPRD